MSGTETETAAETKEDAKKVEEQVKHYMYHKFYDTDSWYCLAGPALVSALIITSMSMLYHERDHPSDSLLFTAYGFGIAAASFVALWQVVAILMRRMQGYPKYFSIPSALVSKGYISFASGIAAQVVLLFAIEIGASYTELVDQPGRTDKTYQHVSSDPQARDISYAGTIIAFGYFFGIMFIAMLFSIWDLMNDEMISKIASTARHGAFAFLYIFGAALLQRFNDLHEKGPNPNVEFPVLSEVWYWIYSISASLMSLVVVLRIVFIGFFGMDNQILTGFVDFFVDDFTIDNQEAMPEEKPLIPKTKSSAPSPQIFPESKSSMVLGLLPALWIPMIFFVVQICLLVVALSYGGCKASNLHPNYGMMHGTNEDHCFALSKGELLGLLIGLCVCVLILVAVVLMKHNTYFDSVKTDGVKTMYLGSHVSFTSAIRGEKGQSEVTYEVGEGEGECVPLTSTQTKEFKI